MYKKEVYIALSLILQLGISVLVPIFLLIVLSKTIIHFFDVDFTLFFIILGVLAGFRNAIVIVRNYINMSTKKDKK